MTSSLTKNDPCKRPSFQKKQTGGYKRLRNLYAIPSVAITVVIAAYSGLIGIYPILLLYAIWLPRIVYKGRFLLKPSKDMLPALVFVAYAIVSVIWSGYPGATARASLEFASMIICTIIISRIVSIESFIKGIILGSSLVLIITLASGHYGRDYFTGEYALVGLFGSKNEVGLFAEIGLFATLIYLFSKNAITEKFLYGFFPLMLCGICMIFSHSATSVVSLAIVLAASGTAWFLDKFAPHRRSIVLTAIVFFVLIIGGTGLYLGKEGELFSLFGKNATLTGRTYLWAEGFKVGLKDPFFGHGYAAFWVPGQIDAEKYWFKFGISARNGFHFHDLFIQTFVDLGVIGFLLVTFIIAMNCIKSLRYMISKGANLKSVFLLGTAIMFLIRAIVEVDFLGPFGIGCVLFYSVLPYLAMNEPRQAVVQRAPLSSFQLAKEPARS